MPLQVVVVGSKGMAPGKSQVLSEQELSLSLLFRGWVFLSQTWAPMEAGPATETFRAVTRSDLKAGSGSPWGVGGWPDALASGEPKLWTGLWGSQSQS